MSNPLLPTTFQPFPLFLVLGVKDPKFAVNLGRDAEKYHMAMDLQWKEHACTKSGTLERYCVVWCNFFLNNQVSQLNLLLVCVRRGCRTSIRRYHSNNRILESMNPKEFLIHLLMRAKRIQLICKTLIVDAWPVILTSTYDIWGEMTDIW